MWTILIQLVLSCIQGFAGTTTEPPGISGFRCTTNFNTKSISWCKHLSFLCCILNYWCNYVNLAKEQLYVFPTLKHFFLYFFPNIYPFYRQTIYEDLYKRAPSSYLNIHIIYYEPIMFIASSD